MKKIYAEVSGMKSRGVSRITAITAIAGLLLTGTAVPQTAHADYYWDLHVKAESLNGAGNTAGAIPYWDELMQYEAGKGNWENAAVYAGNIDEYYDKVAKDYENAIKYYELENEYWLKAGRDWGAGDLQRAEHLRTVTDIYLSSNDAGLAKRMAAPEQGSLAKYEPESGVYLGLYSERDPKMGNYFTKSEQLYGKKHAIYLAYAPWGTKFPNGHAKNAKEAGAGLQIGWEPSEGLDAVVDGAYVRQWARDAKASGIPIFLRYASEMNGAWTKWNGDPQAYIEKFRMIHDIMAEEAPNVAMVWSPGDVPRYSMDAYYPGDAYVDWVGISLYTEPYEHGDPAKPAFGQTPIERLDELYGLYADRKPIMISETAVAHFTNADGEDYTDWALMNLARLYEVMPMKYPRLKAITYFNVDMKEKDSRNNYLLSDNDEMLKAYKTLIAGPNFLTKIEQGVHPAKPQAYTKAEGSASFAESTRIVPFVKIPEAFISKIEYVLNGTVIGSQTKAPFYLELSAGDVPEGSSFGVRVYGADGALASDKSIALSSIVSVVVDGKKLDVEQHPVIVNGSTLAPLRAIFEAMGATVDYDNATRTAKGQKAGMTVSLAIGQATAVKNGVSEKLEQPAELVNNFTMAPVRWIGEAFGGKVEWDGRTRTASIKTGG
ncbi:stalk domain-containing protein [Paenibacillus sp. MBLB4367]|uniref:stalk domain-containing protein n=1 Tax=Paenibacillus sp. MBLB4367 TaxID=3384767 RepID=UPI003907F376